MRTAAVKIERRFGKCPTKGCKTRRVVDGPPFVGGVPIFYGGYNGDALIAAGLFCSEHAKHLTWDQLQGRVNPDKECNAICLGAIGGSCDCRCGGENHGKNHI